MRDQVVTSWVRLDVESALFSLNEKIYFSNETELHRNEFNISFNIEGAIHKIYYTSKTINNLDLNSQNIFNSVVGQVEEVHLRFGRELSVFSNNKICYNRSIYETNDIKFTGRDDDLVLNGHCESYKLYAFAPCSEITFNSFIKKYYAQNVSNIFKLTLRFDSVCIIDENEYVVAPGIQYTDSQILLTII